MKDLFDKVGEFNQAFGISENQQINCHIPDKNKLLYHELMREELQEYYDAVIDGDKIEVADSLADQLYVLIGLFRKHGISWELAQEIFNHVHDSNMSKLGKDGKPIIREDGKRLKGPNYFKPNIGAIINKNNGSE